MFLIHTTCTTRIRRIRPSASQVCTEVRTAAYPSKATSKNYQDRFQTLQRELATSPEPPTFLNDLQLMRSFPSFQSHGYSLFLSAYSIFLSSWSDSWYGGQVTQCCSESPSATLGLTTAYCSLARRQVSGKLGACSLYMELLQPRHRKERAITGSSAQF